MPTYEDLILALSKADQAGNIADAQEIAGLIRELYPNGNIQQAVTPQEVIDQAYIQEEGANVTVPASVVAEPVMTEPVATQAVVAEPVMSTDENANLLTNDGVIRQPVASENITQSTRPTEEIIATLDEAGQQVVVQTPTGMAYIDQLNRIVSNDEAVVAAALAMSQGQETEHPSKVYAQVEAQKTFTDQPANYIAGLTGNIVEGGIGLGSYRDEAMGAVNDGINFLYQAATGGEFAKPGLPENLVMPGDEIKEKARSIDEDFDTAYPKSAIAANVTGGILTGYLAGSTQKAQQLYKWIQGLPKIWKGAALMGSGATIGGGEGLLYGFGAGEEGERVEEALDQGLFGAGIGMGANLAIMPLTYGYSRIANGLKDKSTEAVASLFAISKEAAEIIKETISAGGSTLEDMLGNLKRGGVDKDGAMIADADIATQVITDAVAAAGGQSAATVNRALQDRMTANLSGVMTSLDQNIAKIPPMEDFPTIKQDPKEIAKENAQRTKPARNEAYQKAYKTQIDYLSPKGQKVQEALDEIDEGTLTQILSKINSRIRNSEGDVTELAFKRNVGQDGTEFLTLVDMPTMKQLDFIKRELSDIAFNSAGVLAPGRVLPTMSQEAKDALDLRYKLSKALKEANPDYRKAVKLGQDKITSENALAMGYDMLDSGVTPQMVARMVKDAGEMDLDYARLGIRAKLERVIGEMRPTPSRMPDSKELDEIFKLLSSRDNRQILQTVLSPKEYKKIVKDLDKAEVAIKMRIAVAENSKTAIRGNVLRNIEQVTDEATSIRQVMAEGRGVEATRKIIQRINETQAVSKKHKQIILKELASAMTGTRGKEAIAKLRQVYDAVKNGQQTLDDIEYISNLMYTGINLQLITGAATKGREIRDYMTEEQ